MSGFTINANYLKHTNSTEVKLTITNTVTVNNVVSDPPTPTTTTEKKKDFSLPIVPRSSSSSSTLELTIPPIDEGLRCAFERRFLGICRAVLGNDDLCEEVIDENGDIILSITDLTELIKIVTGANDVEICIQEPVCEVGCFQCKLNPFSTGINRIIVNGMDFCVGYNKISTMMRNEYKICLTKVAF